MLAEKLEQVGERARLLLGHVSPATWQTLRRVPKRMEEAAAIARALEDGQGSEEPLEPIIARVEYQLKELGGVAANNSYEMVRPVILDLAILRPLAEALDKGLPQACVGGSEMSLPVEQQGGERECLS